MSNQQQLEAIQDIRNMMSRSVRFLSLSGLSGLLAGCYALAAGVVVYFYNHNVWLLTSYTTADVQFFVSLGIITFGVALTTSFFLTRRNARKAGAAMWDNTVKNVVMNLGIPVIAGGILCLAFIYNGYHGLVPPTTLIFYGLALVSASSYTFPMIRQLGILQIVLGLINAFFIGYGLIFWMTGFGVLHIIYGAYMHVKHN